MMKYYCMHCKKMVTAFYTVHMMENHGGIR